MSLIETTVEGTIESDGTLVLDQPTNLPAGRVLVVLRQEAQSQSVHSVEESFFEMMEEIWTSQRARSHIPRTMAAVHEDHFELQGQIEDEIEAAIRLQKECRHRRKQTEIETISP